MSVTKKNPSDPWDWENESEESLTVMSSLNFRFMSPSTKTESNRSALRPGRRPRSFVSRPLFVVMASLVSLIAISFIAVSQGW